MLINILVLLLFMEKTTAYFLIILSAVVIYSFSSSYTGQIARSGGRYDYVYDDTQTNTFRVVAEPTTQTYIPSTYYDMKKYDMKKSKTFTITGNTTNHTTCLFNTCTVVSGPGSNQCWPVGSSCGNFTNVSSATPAPLFTPGCTDTDSPFYPTINYFVKGTTTVTFNNGFQTSQTDFCNFTLGSNILQERFCTSAIAQFISSNTVNCNLFNMTCSNGRCV